MSWRTKSISWRAKPLSWRTRRQTVAHLILLLARVTSDLAHNTIVMVNYTSVVAHKTIPGGASNARLGKFNRLRGGQI